MNNYTEQILYHYILNDLNLCSKVTSTFFTTKNLQILYELAQDYVIKYKVAPSSSQIKELLKITNKNEVISDEVVDIIYSVQNRLGEYSADWLAETSMNWAKWQNFTLSLRNLVAYVKSVDVNENNVSQVMERAKATFNSSAILQLDEAPGADLYNAEDHKQTTLERTPTGYSYIDMCLDGGSWAGSLIVFLGPPKTGKSLWLQNLCAQSVINGDDCAYISLELPEPMIMNRIGANLFNIPAMDYKRVSQDSNFMKQKIGEFRNASIKPRGNLWVKFYPMSTLTTTELEAALLKEEERRSTVDKPFKFKKVFIDYINIMQNWRNPNSENTYQKIKNIAEDLKATAAMGKWHIFSATQTNRQAFDATDMFVSDISESYALNSTVDAMFGIIADQLMKAQGKYKLKCLLDRVAPFENTYRIYLNNKEYLRLAEDPNDTYHECVSDIGSVQDNRFKAKNNDNKYSNNIVPPSEPKKPKVQMSVDPPINGMINITGSNLF